MVKNPFNYEKFVDKYDMLVARKKRKLRELNLFNKIFNSQGSFINDCGCFSDKDSTTDDYFNKDFTDNPELEKEFDS